MTPNYTELDRNHKKQQAQHSKSSPDLLEIIKGLYSSLAWHIDNHGAFGMDQHRMNQASEVINKSKATR